MSSQSDSLSVSNVVTLHVSMIPFPITTPVSLFKNSSPSSTRKSLSSKRRYVDVFSLFKICSQSSGVNFNCFININDTKCHTNHTIKRRRKSGPDARQKRKKTYDEYVFFLTKQMVYFFAFAARLLNRSTRPVMSIDFSFPV